MVEKQLRRLEDMNLYVTGVTLLDSFPQNDNQHPHRIKDITLSENYATKAQVEVQWICNPQVGSSILSGGLKRKGEMK